MKRKKAKRSCRNCRWGRRLKPVCAFVIGKKQGAQLIQYLGISGHLRDAACGGAVTITTSDGAAAAAGSPGPGPAQPSCGTCCWPALISVLSGGGFVASNFIPAHSYEIFYARFTHNKQDTHVYGRSPGAVTTCCFDPHKGRVSFALLGFEIGNNPSNGLHRLYPVAAFST